MMHNPHFNPETNTYDLGGGYILKNLHAERLCSARGGLCIIHRLTTGHTSTWPLTYRIDRGIFERHCRHGIGHPAVEQLDFWRLTGNDNQAVHGCCGVCDCFETGN
jgi:hypothetical protein